MSTTVIRYDTIESPLGLLLLATDDIGLCLVGLPQARHPVTPAPDWQHDPIALAEARHQFGAWFAGKRQDFKLPLHADGTAFQKSVWRALCDIPYAATESYGGLARRIGNPRAVRAVGTANGANPLAIIVPCHRVIGSNGSLTGYGGGLSAKQWLLAHERRHAPVEPLELA